MKRLLAVLTAAFTLICCFAGAHAGAPYTASSAGEETRLSMTYTPTSYYSSSTYYSNLKELKLTGNQRLDLINVALSQVGYHEGNKMSQLDGSNRRGSSNYAEYCYWYGKKVLGNDSGFYNEWCAIFVCWSARQAQVPKSAINNACYAHAGTNAYYFNTVTYHSRGSYTPKPGDLIFYDWEGNGRSWDHVGIVLFITNGKLYAVEGNASDMVLIREVSVNDTEIQGYGVPKYTDANASAVNVSNYSEPTRTLEKGMSGNDVRWLQAALLHLGFAAPIDGSFGSNTQRQLKRFQKFIGGSQTGVCDPQTRSAIKSRLSSGPVTLTDPNDYPIPTKDLSRGCKGPEVRWVQAVLKKMGASVTIDGYFGPGTETKVKWAQKKFGLSQTGVVGPATLNKLVAQAGGSGSGSGSGSNSGSTDPNDYPVPTRTLKHGMSGEDVKWLQFTLKKYGKSLSGTGYFGDVTLAAVKAFQRDKGLTQDGMVGPATRAKLIEFLDSAGSGETYPEPTRNLSVGCKGNDVKWLQYNLTRLGYTLSVDGIFGNGTKQKVIAFQKAAGLTQDGIVGPATRRAIKDRL